MSAPFELHNLVKRGNFERVNDLLRPSAHGEAIDINAYDNQGRTPLMYAVESPKAGVELVRLLLAHGASVHRECSQFGTQYSMVALCLAGRDPRKLEVLLEYGADIQYTRDGGYDALIDAAHGRDIERDPRLLDLLKLVMGRGLASNSVTMYQESALRMLSRVGRFDAIRLLLDAGADETQLEWTPLIRAVALDSLAEVTTVVESGANLEERDWWSKTPWLVAIQTGDIAKASFLLERGAATGACGRCGKPSLAYAIENHHSSMLEWLLEIGAPVEQTDDFGTTPLISAVECGNLEGVDVLLKAGANVHSEKSGLTALASVRSREIAIRLLESGADPSQLAYEGRRSLLGFDPDPDEALLDIPLSEFRKGRSRRFGNSNPEKMAEPFWEGMIRAGITAYAAAHLYAKERHDSPGWCAQRFGQSINVLPDGRIVQIAGEHEDSYDPDFCIYNDVFVHEPDGTIHIFGYPESVFTPTDFHSATLVGEYIYIVGSLGYRGTRQYGKTPVYRLHTTTFRMEQVQVRGDAPGWIYKHQALLSAPQEIRVVGGEIVTGEGNKETHTKNERSFVLDIQRLVWRVPENG